MNKRLLSAAPSSCLAFQQRRGQLFPLFKFKMAVVFGLLLMGSMIMASAATLTFRVNMAGQMALGKFNPGNGDTVAVAGSWNSWVKAPLTVSSYDTNIYVGTVTVSDWTQVWFNYLITRGGADFWETVSGTRYFAGVTGAARVPINFFGNYLGHIVGTDMSMANYETNWCTYKTSNGRPGDPFLILKEKGYNFIRLRLFTSSDAQAQADHDGYGCNLNYTIPLAAHIKSLGLSYMLDFHYSDSWGSGPMPAMWASLNFAQLAPAMRSYNSNCIAQLKAAGAMPDFVQIGNELWKGILCPYGEVDGGYNNSQQWSQFGQLMNAAIQGIQDVVGPDRMPVIVVHCAVPNSWLIGGLLAQGVQIDVIGQSFYPTQRGGAWVSDPVNGVSGTVTNMLALYNKPTIVAEVSSSQSPGTNSWDTNCFGFPATLAGQVQFVNALSNAVFNVPSMQVPGVFWWGGDYIDGSDFYTPWGSMFGWQGAFPVADAYGLLPAAYVRPFAPAQLNATAGNGQVTLTWKTDGATSYNVKRSTSSGAETTIANVSGTSYTDTGLANGTTYYYKVSGISVAGEGANSSEISVSFLPTPLGTGDIGPVGTNGSTIYANGVFTVNATGADIWNQSDAFRFVYQAVTGDCDIRARVTSQSNTDPSAKAGVMIRETLDPASAEVVMVTTPTNIFQCIVRGASGWWCSSVNGGAVNSAPNNWVRVIRGGNTFTSYNSANGVNWTPVATNTVTMASTYYVGLAVASHNNAALCTATFDSVTVNGFTYASPAVPAGLSATVGNIQVSLAWTASSGATSYTVQRAPSGGQYTTIGTTTNTSYTDSGLANGTTYYYQVAAVSSYGQSAYSGPTPATPNGIAQVIPQSGGVYHLICQKSGMALDNAGSTSSGSTVIQWSESVGNSNQEWKVVSVGGGYYNLVCQKSGMALDNGGTTNNGAAVRQWSLGTSNINQCWQFVSVGNGYYHLKSQMSGKMLDNNGYTTNGSAIAQWGDGGSGDLNQNWRFVVVPKSGSVYHVVCANSGMALDNAGSTSGGSGIIQWYDSAGNANQEWQLVSVAGGYYHLMCQRSSLVMDNNGSTTGGTTVVQWGDGGSGDMNQNWQLNAVGGGYYNLVCKKSNMALDNNGSTTAGSNVYQSGVVSGATNQYWGLEFVR